MQIFQRLTKLKGSLKRFSYLQYEIYFFGCHYQAMLNVKSVVGMGL